MAIMSFAKHIEYVKNMSEDKKRRTMIRSVSKSFDSDVEIRTCRERITMVRQVRKDEQKPPCPTNWRPLVKLDDGEGYY